MPLDGTNWRDEPPGPKRGGPSDNAVTILIVALAVCLLFLPVSLAAFVDVIKALRGH